MDSQILSVSGIVDFTDSSRAFSMSSFFERRYSLRSNDVAPLVATSSSATVAWLVVKAGLDRVLGPVKAVAQLIDANINRAFRDRETIFTIITIISSLFWAEE